MSLPACAQNQAEAKENHEQGRSTDLNGKEESSVTVHQTVLAGRLIHYTATAGNLIIRNTGQQPYGSIFYVAYTEDGANPSARPVTFIYNGGPGAASFWLHIGSVGPVRVVTNSPRITGAAPYQIVQNQYSLLDQSDLVFVDAPFTGYSRAIGNGTEKDFAGTDQDLQAFTKFITRYISIHGRWNSPKFLMGESYGTTRSAGLAVTLHAVGVELSGITLLSSILNYTPQNGDGTDQKFIDYIPSFAAVAFYHKRLPEVPANLGAFLLEAREFASTEYAEALFRGDSLSPAQSQEIAQKLHHFTGLPIPWLLQSRLRIGIFQFTRELMRDEGKIVGRNDGRFEGTDADDLEETPSYDVAQDAVTGAFTAAFHSYLESELKYHPSEDYVEANFPFFSHWDWHHQPVTDDRSGSQPLPVMMGDLAQTIRQNPKLKVLSASGYYDLSTPFFRTEQDIDHMLLTPELRGNIRLKYYESGHMVYLSEDALRMFRDDLRSFYIDAAK